jgi:hypothetical protein
MTVTESFMCKDSTLTYVGMAPNLGGDHKHRIVSARTLPTVLFYGE